MIGIIVKRTVLAIGVAVISLSLNAGSMGPVAKAHNWTGFFLGGNVGGMWGPFSAPVWVEPLLVGLTFIGPSEQYFDQKLSSVTAGGQIGYLYQAANKMIIGAEFHLNGERLDGLHILNSNEILPTSVFVAGDSYGATNNWHAALLARLGYAWNNWMLYATGGAAAANIRAASTSKSTPAPDDPTVLFPAAYANDNEIMVGGTGGVGMSYALSEHLIIGAEGRYTNFGSKRFNLAKVAVQSINGINSFYFQPSYAQFSASTGEVLVKVNYQF